jgi:hypothetical protein
LPSKKFHHRLPSPTNGPPTLTNSKLYGNDTLNNDDDDESMHLDAESGITKRDSTETMESAAEANSGLRNEFPSRQSSLNQDNDSGHLSLEASASPTNSTPTERSLQQQEIKPKSPPPLAPIFKENPFKVSNKAPNKIILDPIQLPERNIQNGSSSNISNVPRHLFAIKKSER